MTRWLLILLCSTCFAQTQGNLPTVIQSCTADACNSGTPNTIPLKHVDSGTLLFGCQSRGFGANAIETLAITDTLTSTWHYSALTSGTDGGGNFFALQCYYTITGSAGADTLTFGGVTSGSFNESIADFGTGLSVDGSFVAATATGNPATVSASTMTAINGDLVIAGQGMNATNSVWATSPAQFAVYDPEGAQNSVAFLNAGAAGSQTITFNQETGSPRNVMTEWILAFSAALTITDTLLPDADKVQAYSATIHPIGGTGIYACTLQTGPLPTGLALGGTGNCTISGTVTGATGNYPITIRTTESGGGTHVDSSGLSIKVGTAFGTPAVVQSLVISGAGTGTFASDVTSGHAELVLAQGIARHVLGQGVILPTTNIGGSLTSTRGTVFTRALPIAGDFVPNLVYLGCVTSSGPETIHFTDNQTNGTIINMIMVELSNTQPVLDMGVLKTIFSATTPFTFTSSSLTVPVNNESLFSSIGSLDTSGGSSITPTAPFANIGTGTVDELFNGSYDLSASSGSNSMVATISAPATTMVSNLLLALRPEISGLLCGGTPLPPPTKYKSQLF